MLSTSLKPSTENSLRERLGDRTGGFFGNLGDLDISWDVWASLGDFLDSILILDIKTNMKERKLNEKFSFIYYHIKSCWFVYIWQKCAVLCFVMVTNISVKFQAPCNIVWFLYSTVPYMFRVPRKLRRPVSSGKFWRLSSNPLITQLNIAWIWAVTAVSHIGDHAIYTDLIWKTKLNE